MAAQSGSSNVCGMFCKRSLFIPSIVLIAILGFGAQVKAASRGVRVAILDFDAAGTKAEFSDLGPGLQAMLTTDLSQVKSIDIVERRKLSALRTEINFTKSRWADPKTALRVGSLAGATHVLFGTCFNSLRAVSCRAVGLSPGAQWANCYRSHPVILGALMTGTLARFSRNMHPLIPVRHTKQNHLGAR